MNKFESIPQNEKNETQKELASLSQYIEEQRLDSVKNNESKPNKPLSIDKWNILNKTAKTALNTKETDERNTEQASLSLDLPKNNLSDLEVAKKVIGLSVENVLAKAENGAMRLGTSSFATWAMPESESSIT